MAKPRVVFPESGGWKEGPPRIVSLCVQHEFGIRIHGVVQTLEFKRLRAARRRINIQTMPIKEDDWCWFCKLFHFEGKFKQKRKTATEMIGAKEANQVMA